MIRRVAPDGRIETGGAFTPIVRARVVDRIAAASQQCIVLIIAPAGYGKSVALRQYLATLDDAPVVRMDMRAEHATLLGFLRGFSEALKPFAPDARKSVSGAYQKNAGSKTPGADLATWMHAHVKTFAGVIAIDDLHLAEAEPEITRFLVSLIERTKGRLRWILSSRSALDLPVGSWLAYGDMDLSVDEQDLGFTIDEAREIARSVRVSVRDEELAQILTMTGGWPTAMSFALRSSTRSVDLRNIAASTREMVYRYLAEQVYVSLSDADRELLRLIAFLPEIDLDVLRHAGYKRAKARIESLRDRVAFIYPERPGVYRAHDLFADFLRNEVEMQGDEALHETRVRAARALEDAGHVAAALTLLAAERATAELLRILESRGFALCAHAHGDAVACAIEALPADVKAENPVALGLRAIRETDEGRFDRAQSLYERAIAAASDAVLRAELSINLAGVLFDQQRFEVALLEPFAFDESLPADTRARAVSYLVPSYAYLNRRQEAVESMVRAQTLLTDIDTAEVRARMYYRLGVAAFVLQQPFDEVQEYFTNAQTIASKAGIFLTLSAALGGLEAIALLHEDDWTKAAWLAQQAMNAGLKAGARIYVQNALLQLIHIEMRRGTPDRLAMLEKQFAATITSDVDRSWFIVPARALLSAWNGRFDDAFRLLSSYRDRSAYGFDRVFNAALLAAFAFASNHCEVSRRALGEASDMLSSVTLEGLHGQRQGEMARSICAIVETLSGRQTAAHRLLQAPLGARGPQVDAMRACADAVLRAAKNPALADEVADAIGGVYSAGIGGIGLLIERLVAAADIAAPDSEVALTPAEIEVLQGLADGLSPKDIAQQTARSVYTVQAHVQNIIKKLGCSGRAQALTVARKKQLVKFN